jgi:hypothetical protein
LVFPDLPAARVIQMLERLPFYGGALTWAAQAEASAQQGGEVPDRPGVKAIPSVPAVLANHPDTAGLFEFAKV